MPTGASSEVEFCFQTGSRNSSIGLAVSATFGEQRAQVEMGPPVPSGSVAQGL